MSVRDAVTHMFVSGDLANADAAIEMAQRLLDGTQAELAAVRQEHAELEARIVTEGTSPEAVERLDWLERRMAILAPIAAKQELRVEAAHQHKEHVVNAKEFAKLTEQRKSLARSQESHIAVQKRLLPKLSAAVAELKETVERWGDASDKQAKLTGSNFGLADRDSINSLVTDLCLAHGLGPLLGIFRGGGRRLDNETGEWIDTTPPITPLEDAFAELADATKVRYGRQLGLIEDDPEPEDWFPDEQVVTADPDAQREYAEQELARQRQNIGRAPAPLPGQVIQDDDGFPIGHAGITAFDRERGVSSNG